MRKRVVVHLNSFAKMTQVLGPQAGPAGCARTLAVAIFLLLSSSLVPRQLPVPADKEENECLVTPHIYRVYKHLHVFALRCTSLFV